MLRRTVRLLVHRSPRRVRLPALCLLALVGIAAGCSAGRVGDIGDDPGSSDGDMAKPDGDMAQTGCRGRFCQVPKCSGSATTEITGRLFAPNGTDPVPGATVFVPVEAVPEFPAGLTCDLCNNLPYSVATAVTAFDGSFRLRGVPVGTFPVVLRLGRFQRVVQVETTACVEHSIPYDIGTAMRGVRLPRKNAELSPQDRIPRIAVVSGDNDQIECVLKRIGVDELDMYNGRALGSANPPAIAESGTLFTDEKTLNNYHIVVVNCTDNQFQSLIGARSVQQNLERYVGRGGRLYVTDWAYDVIEQVPEFSSYLCFEPQKTGGSAMCMGGPEQAMSADSYNSYGGQYKVLDDEMARWLGQFPGILDRSSRVRVDYSFVVINKVSDNAAGKTKVWVDGPALTFGNRPQTVTLDYKSCGRLHYSTYNTEPNAVVNDSARWPNNCGNKLAPQERLLEYLFFNIAACVGPPG